MWFMPDGVDPSKWTPAKGYSDYFAKSVGLIRDQFGLVKTRTGEARNQSGLWKPYTLQGRDVRVKVTRFRYGEIGDLGEGTLSPVFFLDTVIEKKITSDPTYTREYFTEQQRFQEPVPWWLDTLGELFPNWSWVREKLSQYSGVRRVRRWRNKVTSPGEEQWMKIFDYPIQMVFPENYPHVPPKFRVNSRKFIEQGASHDHHMYSGGWLCILAKSSDWNFPTDNVISGLNAALDWAVKHHNDFGW